MKNEKVDFLDMTVRELLEDYGLMYSPECDYNYGIISYDNATKLFETFDLSDQASVDVMSIIDEELEIEDQEPLTWEKLEQIMDNLGFKKKE